MAVFCFEGRESDGPFTPMERQLIAPEPGSSVPIVNQRKAVKRLRVCNHLHETLSNTLHNACHKRIAHQERTFGWRNA